MFAPVRLDVETMMRCDRSPDKVRFHGEKKDQFVAQTPRRARSDGPVATASPARAGTPRGRPTGRLAPDALLPSSRAFAAQLGVSRGIVVEAYDQLVAEGYLDARPGGTTTVAHAAVAARPRPARDPTPAVEIDLRPGRPDLDEFPRRAWLRSVRRALETAPSERFGYLDGHGVPDGAAHSRPISIGARYRHRPGRRHRHERLRPGGRSRGSGARGARSAPDGESRTPGSTAPQGVAPCLGASS